VECLCNKHQALISNPSIVKKKKKKEKKRVSEQPLKGKELRQITYLDGFDQEDNEAPDSEEEDDEGNHS
jgi:hypothetical protein